MKNEFFKGLVVLTVFMFLGLIASIGIVINNEIIIKAQNQEIAELNQKIGEYRINEAWFEEYVDVLEEIYKGRINEAVLKERIKWLEATKDQNNSEFDYAYADQMYNDLETYVEVIIYYVETNNTLVGFQDYFRLNYYEIYYRIDNIYDENH